MADDRIQAFYDQMAGDYHLIFKDWEEAMAWQGQVIDGLIREELGEVEPGLSVLDCAAGIGTQAIALAKLGYRVYATDLSREAITRADVEARRQGVRLTTAALDMRALSEEIDEVFEVIMAFDNAVPHLLTDDDLALALRHIRRLMKPGGLFMASIRDYDALRDERPTFMPPRVMGEGDQRRVAFQMWDWTEDGARYTVNQFMLFEGSDGWQTKHYTAEYRAMTRETLNMQLQGAGFSRVRWDMTGFYQPVVVARVE